MDALDPIDWHNVPDNIPNIPNWKYVDREHVLECATRIKPLIEKSGRPYHCVADCDHFDASYPWVAKTTVPADLVEVAKIWTLHGYGYYGFFKPSVAEVIVQIPPDLLSKTDFFLVRGPKDVNDLNATKAYVFDNGKHVAQTILYQHSDRSEEVGEYFESNPKD